MNPNVMTAEAWLLDNERLMLYALVRSLEPKRILEIGTYRGGSAAIMAYALDDQKVEGAKIVTMNPNPEQCDMALLGSVAHRVTLLPKASPVALGEARDMLGGRIDFVFIDGDHTQDPVYRDLCGIFPHLNFGATVLMHDGHYYQVREATDIFLMAYPQMIDFGLITMQACWSEPELTNYAGFRLLKRRA
jgi:predicted O-methyltransferase YrrM